MAITTIATPATAAPMMMSILELGVESWLDEGVDEVTGVDVDADGEGGGVAEEESGVDGGVPDPDPDPVPDWSVLWVVEFEVPVAAPAANGGGDSSTDAWITLQTQPITVSHPGHCSTQSAPTIAPHHTTCG